MNIYMKKIFDWKSMWFYQLLSIFYGSMETAAQVIETSNAW